MSTAVEFDSSILERLVVSPESASAVLSMQFSDEDRQQMEKLQEKNNEGSITDEELQLMESYRRIGTFLGIMQARARLFLQSTDDASPSE